MLTVTIGSRVGRFYDQEPAAEWIDRYDTGGIIEVTGRATHSFTYERTAAIGAFDDKVYLSLRNRGVPPTIAGLIAARRYKRANR